MPRTWKQRLPDWERRWHAWLETCRDRPFEWGVHDCVKFGFAGIREVTGQDVISDQFIYANAETAAALIRDEGFASLRDCITYHLGPPLKSYRAAMRGDAALVDFDGLHVLGTVLGERIACPGEHGLVFVPLSQSICCWRI
jgi:hypothetical protein